MKLMIVDNSPFPLNPETEEFIRQLSKNVTIYTDLKSMYQGFWYYDLIKEYNEEEFIRDQSDHDAIYVSESGDGLDLVCKIPYFYNIYAHTWNPSEEYNYQSFEAKYSQVKGAAAVFVDDKKINRFANWLDLNSYFINRAVDTYRNQFIKSRKFLTPKLHVGFIPSCKLFETYNPRNKIVEDMWACAKNNWVLHIPNGDDLDIPYGDNVVRHSVLEPERSKLNYYEIFKHSHMVINPEDWYYDGVDFSHDKYTFDAMATGCVVVKPNQQGTNSDYMFDKVHYFKMDFIDANTLVSTLRYADKRREKLDRMSKAGADLVSKYYDIRKIVQNKIQIMKNTI